MKTLYERIKPEILEKIEADREKFPYVVADLILALKKEVAVLDLSVHNATMLYGYAYDGSGFKLLKFYQMFEYEN